MVTSQLEVEQHLELKRAELATMRAEVHVRDGQSDGDRSASAKKTLPCLLSIVKPQSKVRRSIGDKCGAAVAQRAAKARPKW